MKTQRVKHEGPRIKTGPVKVGDDWTGIFIRGDEAIHLATMLRFLTSNLPPENLHQFCNELSDKLMACYENNK
jgi:hypothetical protein